MADKAKGESFSKAKMPKQTVKNVRGGDSMQKAVNKMKGNKNNC